MLRTSKALRLGIPPLTLYEMRDSGVIEKLSRGLYRLTSMPPLSNPDLVAVALRVPDSVLCLISALAFHNLTVQIPHEIQIAVNRNSRTPRIDHPPVRVFRFAEDAFHVGLETHKVDRILVRVYSPEKTIVDCFKYRSKVGTDTAIEALRLYKEQRRAKIDDILKFARVCRVEKVMRPYLEALLQAVARQQLR
jgi:predicted transcriptional regulator of viral defense system